jgi:hypothetical protein
MEILKKLLLCKKFHILIGPECNSFLILEDKQLNKEDGIHKEYKDKILDNKDNKDIYKEDKEYKYK